jgi:hypothetical protein
LEAGILQGVKERVEAAHASTLPWVPGRGMTSAGRHPLAVAASSPGSVAMTVCRRPVSRSAIGSSPQR